MMDLQACRDPVGVWYRARLVGTPRTFSRLSSTLVGYDGRMGSVRVGFGTTGGVDREYVVVANTSAIAANATAPDLERWRDVDDNGMVDDDTIQLCSHDPAHGAAGQRLGANGYAYAYGPYSRGGTSDGYDSFAYVRTRPIVQISAESSTVSEGDGAGFTVRRYAATDVGSLAAALTVSVSVSETGTMISGAAPTSVTIPEGVEEATFTVPTRNDSVDEDSSDITVHINSDTDYSVSIRAATVTVTDDDLPMVAVGSSRLPIAEGASASFAVSRVGSTTSALTVDLTVSESGGDRVASTDEGSRSVTIPAGDSSVAFGVATVDDSVVEADSTITVTVNSGAGYGVVPPGSASVIVNEDDTAAPAVSVFLRARSTLPVTEGASLVFEVSRGFGDPVTAPLTVNLRVSEIGDVVAAAEMGSRSVMIAAGDRRATFSVATVDDSVAEGDSVVTVEVTGGMGYSFSPFFDSESVAVYDNDDTPPTVAIRSATSPMLEGDIVEFTVIHTGVATSPVTVQLAVSETGDVLYSPEGSSRSFTIPAGTNSATFRVETLNDAEDDWLSVVTVAVASGTGYSVGSPGSASVIVLSDEIPGVSVAPVTSPVSEGIAAGFTVRHQFGPSTQPATVELRVNETGDMLSATALVSVTIPAGDTSATFEVPTVDDVDAEVDSVVTVVIESVDGDLSAVHPSSYGASASVVVHDNENTAPRVNVSPPRLAPTEGTSAGFTVSRSGATSSPLTVALTVSETADMISGATLTSVTIPAGEATATFDVPTDDDGVDEDDSVIMVQLAGGAGYAVGTAGSAIISVRDNDGALPKVRILRGTWDTIEGGTAAFIVERGGPRGSPLTVALRVTETGDVLSGAAPTSVTVPAGETSATFEVTTDDDAVEEGDSIITANVASGPGYTVGAPAAARVPVYDNDAPPTIDIRPTFGATEGGSARFIVHRAGSAAAALVVELTVAETGSMVDADDEGSTSVVIPAGATSATLEVPTDDDDVDEDDSTVTVTISPGTGYDLGAPTSASVIVYDNDDPPTVTIRSTFGAYEGGFVRFIISRTGPRGSYLVVDLNVTETGDMIDPDDEGPTSITIYSRESSATLYVATVDDTVVEDESTVTATITTSTRYATGTPGSASVTVYDEDGTPTDTILPAAYRVTEGTAARLTVYRSGSTTSPLTIELTVTETGDMIDPSDEGPTSFTIPAGEISATFEVPTIDDATDEQDSTLTVTISQDGGHTFGAVNSVQLIVIDNDLPALTIRPGTSPVTEGAFARFTVDRTGLTTGYLTVELSTSETGDMIHTDDERPTSVTFRPGETTATFEVATVDDTVAEDDSTITATITRSSRYTIGTPSSATVTANDNDTPPTTVTITAATSPVTEGDTARFAIDRTGPTTAPLTVELTVTETGDMIDPDDEGSTSITIRPGETSATLDVATIDDTVAEDDSTITATITSTTRYAIGTQGSATITASDDDGTPRVTIRGAPYRVPEGTAARLTVHRSGSTASPLTVELTVTETGDMIDASHEGPTSFTVPAGDISATFEVPTADDDNDEVDSAVTATISQGGGLMIGAPNSARFTVIDNDVPTITIQPGTSPVTEGDTARFTIDRTGPTTAPLTVELTVTETGDMIDADDEGSTSVTILAGETSATLDVATIDDTAAEDDSTITATITTHYTTGTPASATITANDNDP